MESYTDRSDWDRMLRKPHRLLEQQYDVAGDAVPPVLPTPAARPDAPLSSPLARMLGAATLGLAALAAAAELRRMRQRVPSEAAPAAPATFAATRLERAARGLHASAALLGTSVLADSALEHYRGDFENPGMFTPLLSSLMTVLAGARNAWPRAADARARGASDGMYATALAVGAAGTGFHLYNILRRPGGIRWLNLFYAAPLGAPAALSLAGLLGLAAQGLRRAAPAAQPELLGRPAGRLLSGLVGVGLAGTAAEAGLLHFRGAYQNPFMWLPVTIPPVASALMLANAAERPHPKLRRVTRWWLALTGLLGVAGTGFHAYGVGRQMGGWRNTRQNVLSGPPLSAPPSFSALALAGLAALALCAAREQGSSQ